MNYSDINRIPTSDYMVQVQWSELQRSIDRYIKLYNLNTNPEYQRGYIWTEQQQINYVEYMLRGGFSGKDIFFNAPGWMQNFMGTIELVDGKQRISAVLKFLSDKLLIFGNVKYSDFTTDINLYQHEPYFNFHVNNLANKADIIKWYISMNEGGTAHTKEDIQNARNLLTNIIQL
jgi:hypothetical protein